LANHEESELNTADKNLNYLENEGTSNVFCSLLRGNTSPKEIADDLGIKSPSVMEQLERLKELRIVRPDKKEGKYQRYAIDITAFQQLFLYVGSSRLKLFLKRRDWTNIPQAKKIVEILSLVQDVTPEHCLNLILDDLSGDKCFEQFIFNYVKARFMHPKDKPKMLARMMLEFEEGLKDAFPRREWTEKIRDQQSVRFLRSIGAWYFCLTQSMTMSGSAVLGALNETLTKSN
jgi:DNA-binding transcriptional ArsR family regulator